MTDRLRIAVLGATGSIGVQTLEVAAAHADRVEVVAVSAHSNWEHLARVVAQTGVRHVALASAPAAERLSRELDFTVGAGDEAVSALAELPEVDVVVNALVGSAGLRTTVRALGADKTLALANKESLVVGGELVMGMAAPGRLLPVDSEHSAIYQCYVGEDARDVSRIWLTASGGPFRGRNRFELASMTRDDALAHPTWKMGPKITIDSSTLMNKGLEAIEAHHLFGVSYDDIRIVVHPQSCIHSMVEFADGSVKAHLGATDMRIPIQYALSHPRRWSAPLEPVDFVELGRLDFFEPDFDSFRCLALALEAGRTGGTMPAAMNAANEVAVAAFLDRRIGFTDIDAVVQQTMESHVSEPLESIEQVEQVDRDARMSATKAVASSMR